MFRGLSSSCCVLAAAGPGPGPAGARGQSVNMNGPGPSQTPENIQQMKKLMEQELKSNKYKSNSNRGYVFTLMPLYAVGVGVFAAYKFLKVKDEMSNTLKRNFVRQSLQIRLCFSIHRLGLQMIRHKRTVWPKGPKSQLRQVCVTLWFLLFAHLYFLYSNVFEYHVSNVLSLVYVCLFLHRKPAERTGTKTRSDREDAQFHPHPAGPAH